MGKVSGEASTRSARQMSATVAACKGKKRIRWTNELHMRFEQAVADLGGAHYATPKGILERMNEPDVTIMHVKSHLQKYRLTLTAEQQATQKSEPRDTYAPLSGASDGPSTKEGSSPRTEPRTALRNDKQSWCDRSADEHPSQGGSDDAARQKLLETIIQQHQMQKELRHQIQVCVLVCYVIESSRRRASLFCCCTPLWLSTGVLHPDQGIVHITACWQRSPSAADLECHAQLPDPFRKDGEWSIETQWVPGDKRPYHLSWYDLFSTVLAAEVHDMQVQSELHKSLQDQHTLLQHHSLAAQQPVPFHALAFTS